MMIMIEGTNDDRQPLFVVVVVVVRRERLSDFCKKKKMAFVKMTDDVTLSGLRRETVKRAFCAPVERIERVVVVQDKKE